VAGASGIAADRFCAAGCRCDTYSVVVSTSANPRHQLRKTARSLR
jgi:hypothetical protein